MGVVINHVISFLTSPLSVAFVLLIVGASVACKWRRIGLSVVGVGLVWLYCMSSGWMGLLLGLGLEREFPPARVESLPQADAIVVLGGGVGGHTNAVCYTELYTAADRVAHAARIWKAGKAPVVITSGCGELQASLPLLKELGVPESAVLVENEALNTEQNARFVVDYVKAHHLSWVQHAFPMQSTTKDSRQPIRQTTVDQELFLGFSSSPRRGICAGRSSCSANMRLV